MSWCPAMTASTSGGLAGSGCVFGSANPQNNGMLHP